MCMCHPGDITKLLVQLRNGDLDAGDQLIPLVYEELRRLARYYMRRERPNHTLQPTALVNEAYLRLIRQREVDWQSRAHFFAMSARLMRRILVDHARKRNARGRPNKQCLVPIEEVLADSGKDLSDLLVFDDALNRLAEEYPRQARVVDLRFFGGLSEAEIAEALGISVRTVKSDWRSARAWLYSDLSSPARGSAKARAKTV
jgi:RNA polymerase sigma-70 factor (ECF subfamily)